MPRWKVKQGDCLEVLKGCPADFFDAMVTDPPAGVKFMGREWDSDKGGRDEWISWLEGVMREAMRTLKPGAHCLVWALPRTSHWTATAIEDAGFEVRDVITHHFGSGFPKSQDVGKFIDKGAALPQAVREFARLIAAARKGKGYTRAQVSEQVCGTPSGACWNWESGIRVPTGENWERLVTALDLPDSMRALRDKAERHVIGKAECWDATAFYQGKVSVKVTYDITAPGTPEAAVWDGWGTALKPATEHWILARKPLSESSIARNVLKHGTGALNIDACRVDRAEGDVPGWHKTGANGSGGFNGTDTFSIRPMSPEEIQERCSGGRWPANLLLSHCPDCGIECVEACPVAELDRQSGMSKSAGATRKGSGRARSGSVSQGGGLMADLPFTDYGDSGGASRFFPTFRYVPKPSRSEKEAGLQDLPDSTLNRVNPGGIENDPRWAPVQVRNNHPTVKSIALCRWLCRLITPPGGAVLDPFAGSGSIGCAALLEGFDFFGIEEDPHYVEIATARLKHWENQS